MTTSNLSIICEEQIDAISKNGYTVMPSVLSALQIEQAKIALNELFGQEKRSGSRENWSNPQYQVSLCLPLKRKVFRDLCFVPQTLSLARSILGADCVVTSMNGFTTKPGGERQALHSDFPAQGDGLNHLLLILCLDDFTVANGCTRVVPCSQRRHRNAEELRGLESETVAIEASAGSIIACDGDLVHGAGQNCTEKNRLALHLVYSRSWVKPQWDFALSMQKGFLDRLTESERAIFGIDQHPYIYDHYTHRPRDLETMGRLKYYASRIRSKISGGF